MEIKLSIIHTFSVLHASIMVRRETVKDKFYYKPMGYGEDYELFLRLIFPHLYDNTTGNNTEIIFANIPQILYSYNRQNES
jgi:hypothetical protein